MLHINRRQFVAGLSVTVARAQQAGAPAGRKLFVGAATVNISPVLGAAIAGSMTYAPASEIHDELHVRSLALDNGQSRLAFAVVDSCVVPRNIIDKAKELIAQQTGIPPDRVLVSATHTHSAPAATHLFQSVPDPKYVELLPLRIADSVRLAVNRLQPARIGWGIGREDRLVFCRRFYMKPGAMPPDPFDRTTDRVKMNPGIGNPNIVRPEGSVDPDVGVIAVESLEGVPIAVVGNYALHYVGGAGRGHVSADYFGFWADSMARLAGIRGSRTFPPFVGMLTNACSGHTISFDARVPQPKYAPYEKMQWVADVLAAESYRTWRTLKFHDWVELAGSVEELDFGVRLPPADDVARARKILDESPKGEQLKELRQIYARETIILAESYPKAVRAPVQALRIGDLGIATMPGEAFAELGLEVKAKSPFTTTMLIELANDYRGYIPTVEAHQNGGYETWRAKSSYLEVMAAPRMVAAALRQLKKLAG